MFPIMCLFNKNDIKIVMEYALKCFELLCFLSEKGLKISTRELEFLWLYFKIPIENFNLLGPELFFF